MFEASNTGVLVAAVLAAVLAAGVEAGPPLDDPIPGPIPQSRLVVGLEVVADGLSAPNGGTFAPGFFERAFFVTDQDGELWEVDLVTGARRVFLDVRDRLVDLSPVQDERGFLGVAFHPDYATNGLLYTYTSEPASSPPDFSTMPPGTLPDHQSVVTEWTVPNPRSPLSVADPGAARELLRVDQPQANHNGGALVFGTGKLLHIALGDGGSANDQGIGHGPAGNGQNPGTVLGSILRIDPLGNDSLNGQYGVPTDNPGVSPGPPPRGGSAGCLDGFCDEIFAYGFRNPFRISFDSPTGLLVAADVGQNDVEEIDIVVKGGNYGWNLKEGTFCFEPGAVSVCDPGQVPPGLVDPVAQYDHDEGIAVIGGFVYRGSAVPFLSGRYVFGDFARSFFGNGRLFVNAGLEIRELRIRGRSDLGVKLLGFGQDARGEIYVLGNAQGAPGGTSGVIMKIVAPFP